MIPINEVKKSFSKYVQQAERGEVIFISRHGKAVAVLVSSDEYAKLSQLNPQLGLAGLLNSTNDGFELAEILRTQTRTSRESIVFE